MLPYVYVVVFASAFAGGRAPDELDEALVERLGRLTARIHNVGASGHAAHRVQLSGDTMAREPLAFLEAKKSLPARLEARYFEAANEIAEKGTFTELGTGYSGGELNKMFG